MRMHPVRTLLHRSLVNSSPIGQLVGQMSVGSYTPGQCFDKMLEALLSFGTGCGTRLTGQGRGHRKPAAQIECERLVADLDMVIEPVELP